MAAPAAPPARRAAVVVNPTKTDVAKLRKIVAKAERAAGWGSTHWYETTEDDPGLGQAETAISDGATLVIAAGGDGTVRAVAQALRGTDVALGLLPFGTGNLLARNLGLDLNATNLDGWVATAFGGEDRQIDIGVIDLDRASGPREQFAFLVMAGLGIDAKMVANTRPELKRRVGWLAYVDAIARSMRDKDAIRVRYRLDGGEEKSGRAHTFIVGNCGVLPGNLVLLPDATLADGLFEIVTLRPEGFGGWLRIWVAITWENGVMRRSSAGRKILSWRGEIRALRYLRSSEVAVRLERPQEFELDGDDFGSVIGFRARVHPGGVRVRVSASA